MVNKKTFFYTVTVIFLIFIIVTAALPLFYNKNKETENKADNGVKIPEISIEDIDTGNINISFRANDKYFFKKEKENWNNIFLKGVNIGLTEATTDLNNPSVSYDTYIDWFNKISEMNANTVKVFTVMPPQFYNALYDYNQNSDSPLYLLQGIWFNENFMYELDSAFDDSERIVKAFKKGCRETVDIVHGKSDYTDYGEIKNAFYGKDISEFVIGFVLGLEWNSDFVIRTNNITDKKGFSGNYLYTDTNATAFESFLCNVGDYLIEYQTENYLFQTPVSFLNWSTTDTLNHTNEPFDEEDAVSVNTENILSKDNYYTGLFASVDVYPYYPEFINYQPEYNNKGNNYKAYLSELKKEYSVPLIIAEFGVPTSRGMAHTAANKMHQGGITEQQQGEYIISMMYDIAESDCAGGMIFSWQDEWFKQTWNTYKFSAENANRRTPNRQSAEQSYGILAMEPGKTDVCIIDGKDNEWINVSPVLKTDEVTLKTNYDEGYLYVNINVNNYNFNKDVLYLPVSISGFGSDFYKEKNIKFSDAADFILIIDGKDNTRILTDSYEDLFDFMYSFKRRVFPIKTPVKNSGKYNTVKQFLSNEIVLPLSNEVIAPRFYESGLLTYGISDAKDKNFNSLADFYYKNSVLEVRIPWYLLNVVNSTAGIKLNDFYSDGEIYTEKIKSVKIGFAKENVKSISLYDIGYKAKDKSYFHTRLKKSYNIIKENLKNIK